MKKMKEPFPEWVNEHLPPRGPCAFCGGPDARHRIIDAMRECHHAGDSVEVVAAAYELPVEFVRRVVAL